MNSARFVTNQIINSTFETLLVADTSSEKALLLSSIKNYQVPLKLIVLARLCLMF